MSSTGTGKRSTTPKKQGSRSQLQQKERLQDDVCVRTGLPPCVEGSIYAILICHLPKFRWIPKHQTLCRSITIKLAWWGEDDTSATFKPQISGVSSDHRQQPSTTAKYYIRSELKQFTKYLIDAAELVLKVYDTDTNRMIGSVKVKNLSTLSINNPIKGYLPLFSNKGDKLGELLVALRILLPGNHDSNENLAALSYASDVSNPPSRRNSFGANDFNRVSQLENDLRTNAASNDITKQQQQHVSTVPLCTNSANGRSVPPGMQAYKELPTGRVIEELIERANRLRENVVKSSSQKTSTQRKNKHSTDPTLFGSTYSTEFHGNKSCDMLMDDIDPMVDSETICHMIGVKSSLKSTVNLNDSYHSIITDLDGLENEQSLLEDLLYGGSTGNDHDHKNKTLNTSCSTINHTRSQHGKPPTGRSRSPSLTRVHGRSNRPRSRNRSQSLTRSYDSDVASRISNDMPNSDVDDSENESHNEDELSLERIQLLSYVRSARIRIDYLRLNILNGRESPSHSSFGRTNRSKRAIHYYIEYQFPTMASTRDGQINEITDVMKIASKRFESNNDIAFSHLSSYGCIFNETTLKSWWRSLLIFKIYSRMSGTSNPEQIGFAVLPLRNIFTADYLHIEQDINVIDRTQINHNQKIPNKVAKKFCIGQLHLMLELDSDRKDFKTELDRIQLMEQMKPKSIIKAKRTKRTKKSIINSNKNVHIPRSFLSNEQSDLTDGTVVQLYLSIVEARNIPQATTNNNLPRNPYFICRAFWNEEPITSVVCWGSSTPRFNFQQRIPILLTRSTIEKMHQNFVIIELWDKKISGPSDEIIGIVKIPLEQFYISFKDKQISRVLLRAQYPVISMDSWMPIIDPFTTANKFSGDIQIFLAMGTTEQITAVQIAQSGGDLFPSSINNNNNNNNKIPSVISNNNEQSSSLIEHHFEIMIESINGLRAFESMVWGESDCFIQYSFPVQNEQQATNINSIKPFQMRTIRTATTLCTSDPTFHDTNRFVYILSPADALHKYFYAACQSSTPIEASIPFEIWSRFYYPNIRDQLLAKGKISAAKLCSMTTMLNDDVNEKSTQSFRIPLEIVRDDAKHEQHHYSSTPAYGGDLLLTVTYKRNVVKRNEPQAISGHLSNDNSQVSISVGIMRACGLKQLAMLQVRHDTRFSYPSQVGLNTYAKVTLSFLSDMESRSTKTIGRSFVPDFNHTINFPIPLIWTDHRNRSISLADMLEQAELKVDIYHQMNSDSNEKQLLDIHICYCKIPLKELLIRHTGIKGWYPLASTFSTATSDSSSDSIDNFVGGIELFVRFGQQDDRRRMIDSAKRLGSLQANCLDEENFLDDQKDSGCLVKLSIDRIQFPLPLAIQTDKDRLSVFAQYRFYDKMPIITKRKKATIDRNNVICELQFNKEHLFLCSEPFLWYLREEKLEIQIWTSENDTYDYSQSLASTTDKLIGSIYVDLNSLCNRKRKSHRLNAILPLFKQGTKDLSGASVKIHLTIDKSKDFNEIRSQQGLNTVDDVELDSYLDNRYLNLISNDRALRNISNNIFSVLINIEQAAHLPNIYSQHDNTHIPPNPYVTYSTADSNNLCRTQVLTSTTKPQWSYQQSVKLSIEHLFNEKKVFILKVWHKINADIESIPEKSGDKVLGFVSIDLSPLLSGLQQISGWYNIADTIGNVQGQLKISITPQEDLFEFKRMKYNSQQYQPKLDSSRSTSTKTGTVPSLTLDGLSARSSNGTCASLNTSIIEDDSSKQSILMNNLRRQLGELDVMTERLKARYNSNSEVSSTTRLNSASSLPSINSLNIPITKHPIHQDNDSTHSTTPTTTIQKNLLEQFPESLSGKPLISNGLNITDVLSLHNDQVRIAQELVTKANHLLEASKDFFEKPPIIPTPPVPSNIIENEIVMPSSPPPPPALPNFNTTKEFQIDRNSPRIDTTHQFISNSFDQHRHLNDSMVWSDEEDNEHDQSFLPIGLPPIYHRSMKAAVATSPLHLEENPPHEQEEQQQDDGDIIHIRPLNNLSAFNFDCQQMNAERLNGSLTNDFHNDSSHHHPVYSPDTTMDNNHSNPNPYRSTSYDCQSPEPESSSSDTSSIDDTNIQMKQVNPSTRNKTPLNFFRSNHDMEASMKQLSQALTTSGTNSTSNNLMKTIHERIHSKLPTEKINTKRIEQIFHTKYPSN